MLQTHINQDDFIERWGNGVRLVSHPKNMAYPLASAMQLPFNVFFCDTDLTLQKINESCAKTCGFDSPISAIGARATDFVTKANAELITQYDQESLLKNKIFIAEHDLHLIEGPIKNQLAVRAPWYDDHGKIIGIFGCAIAIGEHSLAESLMALVGLGLMMPSQSSLYSQHNLSSRLKIDNVYLSKREMECLKLMVRGKTARETAEIIGLAKRTVESYIENIKFKLGVSRKSELIEKALDYF